MEYVYSALLLHKLGKPVDEEGIKKVLTSAGVAVDEGKVKSLVASLSGVDIEAELANAVVASAASAAGAASESAEEKKEKAPKEEKKEASAEGLSALFG